MFRRIYRGSPRLAAVGLLASLLLTSPKAVAGIVVSADEQALVAALDQRKFIRARERAEALLARQPQSIIGRYGLARVYHLEEANLPRALHQIRLAESALLASYGDPPRGDDSASWHRRILIELETIFGLMDRRIEQLATIARHNALYAPKRLQERVWPLMKLHRFAEAEAIARSGTLSSSLEERISGYNGLLSIEFERQRPKACYDVAMRAVRATAYRSCTLNLNTAEAAFAVFRFAEAEHLALQSIQAPLRDCASSAHTHLANFYLLKADFKRAIAAVRDARKVGIPPRDREQFEAGISAWLTRLLYTLGHFERSEELAAGVLRQPDRLGLTSFSPLLMETIHTIDLYAVLAARIEQQRERVSARSLRHSLREWARLQTLRLRAWGVRRQAGRLLARSGVLPALIRPYLKPIPSWLLPVLGEIAGRGLADQAMSRAFAQESAKTQVAPYFAAFRGEAAFRQGDCAEAERQGQQASAGLPKEEALLQVRVLAWRAACALRQGKLDLAQHNFEQVLYRWPTALRLLGIALPAVIQPDKDSFSQALARRLRSSRRLTLARPAIGFTLDIHAISGGTKLCLRNSQGRVYNCVTVKRQPKQNHQEQLSEAADAFHAKLFAPLIDLTQQDINSLDGRAVRGRADEVLKEVLGQ